MQNVNKKSSVFLVNLSIDSALVSVQDTAKRNKHTERDNTMKEITKYSRLVNYLEKVYDLLNADFFNGELERPVITVQSTPRAYGHYTLHDAWSIKGEGYKELNLGAGTLDRPIENIIATLLHEMCHQYNQLVIGVQDCSRYGSYHNKYFKETAERHALIVARTEKYGWSHTQPSNELLDWIKENDILQIRLNRNEPHSASIGGIATPNKAHNYRYVCPCCHSIARSGKPLQLICGDCMSVMVTG